MSTFQNWELFGDKELADATRAFHTLATSFHYSCFSDEAIIKQIMKIVISNKIPNKVKISIMQILLIVEKNINFKKYFLT